MHTHTLTHAHTHAAAQVSALQVRIDSLFSSAFSGLTVTLAAKKEGEGGEEGAGETSETFEHMDEATFVDVGMKRPEVRWPGVRAWPDQGLG